MVIRAAWIEHRAVVFTRLRVVMAHVRVFVATTHFASMPGAFARVVALVMRQHPLRALLAMVPLLPIARAGDAVRAR